mgnify:CR=1 FL=1
MNKVLYLAIFVFFCISFSYASEQISSKNVQKSNEFRIFPVEGGKLEDEHLPLVERQKINLYLHHSNTLETLYISTVENISDYDWVIKGDDDSRIDKPDYDWPLYIFYRDKIIFSTKAQRHYDYITFKTICNGLDGRHSLVFQLNRAGSANGDVDDALFVFYDPIKKNVQYKIVDASRYMPNYEVWYGDTAYVCPKELSVGL